MIERCGFGATNVIFDLSIVTIAMELSAETYAFTAVTNVQTVSGNSYYCGTFMEQTLIGGASGNPCVMGTTFTITLPASADDLYLQANSIGTDISKRYRLPIPRTGYCHQQRGRC